MDEDDKAAAAGAGGSPAPPAITPAPPSVEAINAFSIPALDISQDETGAAAPPPPTAVALTLLQGWCCGTRGQPEAPACHTSKADAAAGILVRALSKAGVPSTKR